MFQLMICSRELSNKKILVVDKMIIKTKIKLEN